MDARKKVYRINPPAHEKLHTKIEETAAGENEIEEMREDFHLLRAAVENDQIIISLDETIR